MDQDRRAADATQVRRRDGAADAQDGGTQGRVTQDGVAPRTADGWQPGRCARCGAAFDCGAGLPAQGPGCWCVTLPSLPAPARGDDGAVLTGCLCPACLRAEIDRQHAADRARSGPVIDDGAQ